MTVSPQETQTRQAAIQLAIQANGSGQPDVMQEAREFYHFLNGQDIVLDYDITEENALEMVTYLRGVAEGADLLPPGFDDDTTNVIDARDRFGHSYTQDSQPNT